MQYRGWWLQLLLLQWINAWRLRPVRFTLKLLLWIVPVVVAPLCLVLANRSGAALEWLLSLDIPLAMAMAAQSGSAITALRNRPDTESWVMAEERRGVAGRLLLLARLLHAVRWPVGMVVAVTLLSLGGEGERTEFSELLVIASAALILGAVLAWALASGLRTASSSAVTGASRANGLAALSWAPLHEARRQLNLRRLALLAVPVMLLAPMGTPAQHVLQGILAWVPLLFLLGFIREAARNSAAIRRWLPLVPARLHWWIWRHVALVTLLAISALAIAWRPGDPVDPARP